MPPGVIHNRRWRDRKKTPIEPLKKVPDYDERNRVGSRSRTAAINVNRIYFVNENYERLVVSSNDVQEGGEPTRFTGQLPYMPVPGKDIISTDDFKRSFMVIGRRMIPVLSLNIPPKVYIILREIKNKV